MTSAEAGSLWSTSDWPIGAMGAAALGAAEAFKSAMRRLARAAQNSHVFTELFDPTTHAAINLALPGTPEISSLKQIDFVSGGAINSNALYALLRLPHLNGTARIIEHDIVSLSNLNRGMLFLISQLHQLKANTLAAYGHDTFERWLCHLVLYQKPTQNLVASPMRLSQFTIFQRVGTFRERGRDGLVSARRRILTLWLHSIRPILPALDVCIPGMTQRSGPSQLWHSCRFGQASALAVLYLKHLAGNELLKEQQLHFSPRRPEYVWKAPVQWRLDCPIVCGSQRPLVKSA